MPPPNFLPVLRHPWCSNSLHDGNPRWRPDRTSEFSPHTIKLGNLHACPFRRHTLRSASVNSMHARARGMSSGSNATHGPRTRHLSLPGGTACWHSPHGSSMQPARRGHGRRRGWPCGTLPVHTCGINLTRDTITWTSPSPSKAASANGTF